MTGKRLARRWFALPMALVAILAVACQPAAPTPTPTPAPPTTTPTPEKKGRIVEATMAKDVDIAQRPVNPTESFPPDAVVYVSVRLADVKKGSQVTAKWYSRDDLILSKTLSLEEDYDSVYASFNISRTGDKLWPEGPWRVDLYLGDKLEKSVSFAVKAAAATPSAQLAPYQDAALGFSVDYPPTWKVTKLNNGVDIQKPGSVVLLMVRVLQGAAGTTRELSDSFIEGVKEKAPDLQIVKRDELTDDKGVRWALTSYTYTESGIKLGNSLFTTIKGGRTYFVVAVAPYDIIAQEFDATLGPMMDSMRLQ